VTPDGWAVIGVGALLFLAIRAVVDRLSRAIQVLEHISDEAAFSNKDKRELERIQQD